LLPADSTMYANAAYFGYAWRNFQTGAYSYVEAGSTRDVADASNCTAVNITMVPGGKIVLLKPALPANAGLGTPVFLISHVRYEFKNSVAVPGKLGLWRTVIAQNGNETAEELVAPFANTAKWKFFTLNGGAVAADLPPADLTTLRGLELHLDGMSEYVAPGRTTSESAPFTTAVYFKNRIN
jgi:hypothetical protein